MAYAPELQWTNLGRESEARCSTCRWAITGVTMADVRMHALRHPGHRIVVVNVARTGVVFLPPGRKETDGQPDQIPNRDEIDRAPGDPVCALPAPTERRVRKGVRGAVPA